MIAKFHMEMGYLLPGVRYELDSLILHITDLRISFKQREAALISGDLMYKSIECSLLHSLHPKCPQNDT